MAFTNTLNNKYLTGGLVIEEHAWQTSGGTTGGDIVLDTHSPLIGELICAMPSSTGATAVITTLTGNTATLKCTANDGGRVTVIGKAV